MARQLKIRSERILGDLTGVGKTVQPLVKQLLGTGGLIMLELLSHWDDIVGAELAPYALPQKVVFRKNERSNGTLVILTLSGAFAMEVKQREPKILQKINAFFGYPAVDKLKITQTGQTENFGLDKKPIEKLKKNVVSEAEENYITELTKDIQSEELRAKMQSLGEAIWRRNKKEEN